MSPGPAKPSIAEVHAVLSAHAGLIVHFSGAPKGSGVERGHMYPQDLLHVIAGHAMGGVSCSVVKPGDNFYGIQRNATGCIGVILDLTAPESLVAVSASDCGSIEGPDGIRIVQHERDIAVADVEASISGRLPGTYNEWVIRNFKVVGVLAVPPFEISVRGAITLPPDIPEGLIDTQAQIGVDRTSLSAVASLFPSLPTFTFAGQHVFRLSSHSDVYP